MGKPDAFFHKVMLEHVGAESVDAVYEAAGLEGERADYLMRNRSVIVELKELKEPPMGKLFELLKPYADEVGMGTGLIAADEVIRRSPRGAELTELLNEVSTKRLRRDIEDAHGQIRATKRTLKLNSAIGLVFAVNVSNTLITEMHIMQALLRQMGRRQEQRFESIQHVAVLSVHHVVTEGPHKGRNLLFASQPRTQAEVRAARAAAEIMNNLMKVAAPGVVNDPSVMVSDGTRRLPVGSRHGMPVIAPSSVPREEIQKALLERQAAASTQQRDSGQPGG